MKTRFSNPKLCGRSKAALGSRINLKGFTLMELLVTIAIVGIIAAVAYPSYANYTKRAYRADATTALMQAASALERFRTSNYKYSGATLGASGIFPDKAPLDSTEKFYDLVLVAGDLSDTTYTIEARPIAGKAMKDDWTLRLEHTGAKSRIKGATTENDWNLRESPP